MDAEAGQLAAVLALGSLYVHETTRTLHTQDPTHDWIFPFIPLPHLVDVKVHYTELFIFTVFSASTGELPNCYVSLIPPNLFNQPHHPISFCGWWVELTHALQRFLKGKTTHASNF